MSTGVPWSVLVATHPCAAESTVTQQQSANFVRLVLCCLVELSSGRVSDARGDTRCAETFTLPRPIHCVVVWSADSEGMAPDRSLHRSTRRDQLVYPGADAHRVLTVRPTVLVEGLVLDVVDCIACCAVVPLILALIAVTDCTNSMQEFRVAPEHGMSPRGYNWTQMLVASITPVPDCWAKAVMRASLLLSRSRP